MLDIAVPADVLDTLVDMLIELSMLDECDSDDLNKIGEAVGRLLVRPDLWSTQESAMTRSLAIDGAAVAGKMKRRAFEARRFGGARDEQASQALAEDYRDPDRQGQDSEDGQPGLRRVGLPRSRRP